MKRSLIFALVLALLLAAPARAAEPFHPAYLAGYPDGTVRPLAPATRRVRRMVRAGLSKFVRTYDRWVDVRW